MIEVCVFGVQIVIIYVVMICEWVVENVNVFILGCVSQLNYLFFDILVLFNYQSGVIEWLDEEIDLQISFVMVG